MMPVKRLLNMEADRMSICVVVAKPICFTERINRSIGRLGKTE